VMPVARRFETRLPERGKHSGSARDDRKFHRPGRLKAFVAAGNLGGQKPDQETNNYFPITVGSCTNSIGHRLVAMQSRRAKGWGIT
jgi:hypothetical protein